MTLLAEPDAPLAPEIVPPPHRFETVPLPADGSSVVLWTHTVDRSHTLQAVADGDAQTVPTRSRVEFLAKRGRDGVPVVSCHRLELVQGRASHRPDAKMFARWRVLGITSLTRGPGGVWLLRERDQDRRARRRFYRTGYVFAENLDRHARAQWRSADQDSLYGYARAFLGAPAPETSPAPDTGPDPASVYPLLAAYRERGTLPSRPATPDYTHHSWGPAPFRRAFVGVTDVPTLTRRLFGASRYRRDLAREVAQARLDDLCLAWQFRGLVPVDWIIALLRDARTAAAAETVPSQHRTVPLVRQHLRGLDRTSLRRLAREAVATQATLFLLRDLAKWRATPVTAVRSWADLHDQAAVAAALIDQRTGKPVKARRIRLDEDQKALCGDTPAGRRVVLADTDTTLIGWGVAMHHCIGTYAHDMVRGTSWLGAVYEGDRADGAMIGNFEIAVRWDREKARAAEEAGDTLPNAGRILLLNQFLGRFNAHLPVEVRRDLEAHLTAHGIDTTGPYWGSGRHTAA